MNLYAIVKLLDTVSIHRYIAHSVTCNHISQVSEGVMRSAVCSVQCM